MNRDRKAWTGAVDQLVAATYALDADALDKTMRGVINLGSAVELYERVFAPAMERVSRKQAKGDVSLVQVRLLRDVLEQQARALLSLIRPAAPRYRALLLRLDDRQQMLPLLGAALHFASMGFGVTVLSQRLSATDCAAALTAMAPDVLGLAVSKNCSTTDCDPLLSAYASHSGHALWIVGGDGAASVATTVRRLGGLVGTGDWHGDLELVLARLDGRADTRVAEEAAVLDASGDLFRLAVDASPSGMIVVNEAGRIVLVNRTAELLFGFAPDELVGQPIERLVPKDLAANHPKLRSSFARAPVARKMGTGRSLFAQRKDGSTFPVEVGLNPINTAAGRLVLSAIIDRTEWVDDQRRLEAQAEALRRSNAELEQFAYVASHDLQEPLRMIAGFVGLLARKYKGQLDERADQYIAYATDGANRMQKMLKDLLDFSRVGRDDAPMSSVDLNDVLQAARDNLGEALDGCDVRIDSLPTVHGRGSLLLRVFQNLISNAIKFQPSDRAVPPLVRITAERHSTRQWCVAVTDNGIGFDAERAPRLFEMFQRLHSRDDFAGSGIGLAIVKRIIQAHGGQVWAESQPGHGATFFVTLPNAETT